MLNHPYINNYYLSSLEFLRRRKNNSEPKPASNVPNNVVFALSLPVSGNALSWSLSEL